MNKTIFKLALKNLFSHKTKTLIIMILIGLGRILPKSKQRMYARAIFAAIFLLPENPPIKT